MRRFIVVQTGARHNYVVPALLERSELLEAFYTDLCADSGYGAFLDRFCPQSFKRGALSRLLNRRVPPELVGKLHTFDWEFLRYLVRQKWAGSNPVKRYQALDTFHQEFSQSMIRKGLGQATHVFCMQAEGFDFIEFAKKQGLVVVTDVYISPIVNKILQIERERYPGLESETPSENLQRDEAVFRRICEVTDVFIAPSQFVLDGLREFGVSRERCNLIPYAVDNSWFNLNNSPIKNRILFVGAAGLRKGIHILGMAAQKLNRENYEFRIAGSVSDVIRNHEITKKLRFLEQIPRAEIQHEFAQADIFVLPSLAEGSAGVIYEALAVGLPVIATKAAGSVVRDGIEGFIVPEGDSEALAERIEELLENRELRDRMASAARVRAMDFTWDKYAEKLLTVLA
jgi:glycosyltransferase involved in cell wall biosynthesis